MKKWSKLVIMALAIAIVGTACNSKSTGNNQNETSSNSKIEQKSETTQITSDNKDKALKKPVMIFFSTSTWPACQQMESVISDIISAYGDKVNVVTAKLDTNNSEYIQLANQYDIVAVPTLIFLDSDGKFFFKRVGFYDESHIKDVFKKMGIE